MIHYAVTIGKLAAAHNLTSGQVSVLYALWACVSNPFADEPSILVSYRYLAKITGLAKSSIKVVTCQLARAPIGALRKAGSAKGQGTRYVLLRPEHAAEDALDNPFQPDVRENTIDSVTKSMRADGLVGRPRQRAKRVEDPPSLPGAPPSRIALSLEDMSGMEPHFVTKDDGTKFRKARLPFSAKCGDWSAVRAAQAFIGEHGVGVFKQVCNLARVHESTLPTDERVRLFDRPERLAVLTMMLAVERPSSDDVPEYAPIREILPSHEKSMALLIERGATRERCLVVLPKIVHEASAEGLTNPEYVQAHIEELLIATGVESP